MENFHNLPIINKNPQEHRPLFMKIINVQQRSPSREVKILTDKSLQTFMKLGQEHNPFTVLAIPLDGSKNIVQELNHHFLTLNIVTSQNNTDQRNISTATKRARIIRYTIPVFLERAKEKYGDKFDYSKIDKDQNVCLGVVRRWTFYLT